MKKLRPYQLRSLEAIAGARASGLNRLLVKKPTGTGKTVTFAELLKFPAIDEWLREVECDCIASGNVDKPKQHGADPHAKNCGVYLRAARMLVIAHREELLDQAVEKIKAANPRLMVSIEQGDRHANRYSDVVVASIQTLSASKYRRLKALIRFQPFRIVVVDEAHHAAAATYRTTLVYLGFLPPADASASTEMEAAIETDVVLMEEHLKSWDEIAPKDRLLLGFTATPNRSDAIGLGCVFQTIAFDYALKDAISDGYLVPIEAWVVDTRDSLDAVKTRMGEFNQRELADVVNNEHRNALAVESYVTYAGKRQGIVFSVDVAHAAALAQAFKVSASIEAEMVSGETEKWRRRDMLEDYRRGNIQVLCNCMVLTEGTDLPMAGAILHAKPTQSATLYEQMTGRGLRPHPDDPVGPERLAALAQGQTFLKEDCVVIDLVDIARKHSLQTAPVLYGLPPNIDAKGKKLDALARGIEAMLDKYPGLEIGDGRTSLELLEVRASKFSVWEVPELGIVGAGLDLGWMKVAEDTFRLQYPWQDGSEVLLVAPNLLGKFDITATLRPANGLVPIRQRTILHDSPSAAQALMVAELFVKNDRPTVVRLRSRNQAWRHKPVTPGQLGLLRKLGAPIRPNLTSGQASDMIDLANARRAR